MRISSLPVLLFYTQIEASKRTRSKWVGRKEKKTPDWYLRQTAIACFHKLKEIDAPVGAYKMEEVSTRWNQGINKKKEEFGSTSNNLD